MPHQRARLGQRGELLAARYLETQGYRILSRNVNTPSGEIDIVALDGDTLVIVEVRTTRKYFWNSSRIDKHQKASETSPGSHGVFAVSTGVHPSLSHRCGIGRIKVGWRNTKY
jgi:hypothetical protein